MDQHPFALARSALRLHAGYSKVVSRQLGSLAWDILAALVERPGEAVSKEELIARAWPNTMVDNGNHKLQIGALRRAWGDGRDSSPCPYAAIILLPR